MTQQPLIKLKNISFSYKDTTVIKNLTFDIYEGEVFVLMGPGGCGKSTLFKLLAEIYPTTQGQILYRQSPSSEASKRGFLFQNNALFDSMTIFENIGFYYRFVKKIDLSTLREKVKEVLKSVKLENIEHLKPSALSGGMKKRVGLARAIIYEPDILFLDEPTAGLDPVTSDAISQLILEIKDLYKMTVLVISNDLATSKTLADRIAIMHDKTIHEVDAKEAILHSKDPLVVQFLNGFKEGPIHYRK